MVNILSTYQVARCTVNWGKLIAEVNILVNSGAAIGYFAAGDTRKSLYWLLCAAITAVVTF